MKELFFYFVLGVISGVVLFPILMSIFVFIMGCIIVVKCMLNGGICRL